MFTTAHNSFARLPDSFCSTRRILGIFKLEFIGLWVRAKELSDTQSHSDAARRNVREKSVFFVFSQIRFFFKFYVPAACGNIRDTRASLSHAHL